MILEVQSMKKLTTWVCNVFYALLYINGNEPRKIGISTLSFTSKYQKFEVRVFDILNIEGQKYEEVDYSS